MLYNFVQIINSLVWLLIEDNLGITGFIISWIIIYLFMMLLIAFGYFFTKLLIGTPKIKKGVILAIIPISFLVSLIIVKGVPTIFHEIKNMEGKATQETIK